MQLVRTPPALVRWRTRVGGVLIASYVAQYLTVAFAFDEMALPVGVLFVTINLCLAGAFYFSIKPSAAWLFYGIAYAIYSVAYIFKAVVQYAVGLNTRYSWITIRTHIKFDDYVAALEIVTVGHVVLVIFGILAAILARPKPHSVGGRAYLPKAAVNRLLNVFAVWIVLTSIVMYAYGVAVMGTVNVSLPYRLAGIFFYSRTIAIPMMLLYFVEGALRSGDAALLRKTVGLFVFLAASEVIVRATKSPLFILVLLLGFLYALLIANREDIRGMLRARSLALLFGLGLAIWPVVEIYRTMVVEGTLSVQMAADVLDYVDNSDRNFAVFAIERLFQRLAGFLQLAGVVADSGARHDIAAIVSHGSIATYYTEHHLGYSSEGHLSSPSLLGAALILGGEGFWYLVFAAYLSGMGLAWRSAFIFPRMALPVAAFLGVEMFNTMIAGTIDASAWRIALIFALATLFEVGIASSMRRITECRERYGTGTGVLR